MAKISLILQDVASGAHQEHSSIRQALKEVALGYREKNAESFVYLKRSTNQLSNLSFQNAQFRFCRADFYYRSMTAFQRRKWHQYVREREKKLYATRRYRRRKTKSRFRIKRRRRNFFSAWVKRHYERDFQEFEIDYLNTVIYLTDLLRVDDVFTVFGYVARKEYLKRIRHIFYEILTARVIR